MEWAKVLLVDHEQGGYEALGDGLAKHGYQIHTTAKVTKALELAGAHHYQAALVSLPLIAATSLLLKLHAEYPDLPLIVVLPPQDTECVSPQVLQTATHIIGKPLRLDPVRLLLDRTLELVALRRRVRQQRQAWCQTQVEPAPENGEQARERPGISLDVMWATKLRHIVPNLEVVGGGSLYRAVLSYVEKLLLTIVLREFRGNQVRAAEVLGINRNTLRKKIRDFDLKITKGGA